MNPFPSITGLGHVLHSAMDLGGVLILAAIAVRLLYPVWKGGR